MTPSEILRQIPWTRDGYLQVRQIHAEAVEEGDDQDTIKMIRCEMSARSQEFGQGRVCCQECGTEYDPKADDFQVWAGGAYYSWRKTVSRFNCPACFKNWAREETRRHSEYWYSLPDWERRKILQSRK